MVGSVCTVLASVCIATNLDVWGNHQPLYDTTLAYTADGVSPSKTTDTAVLNARALVWTSIAWVAVSSLAGSAVLGIVKMDQHAALSGVSIWRHAVHGPACATLYVVLFVGSGSIMSDLVLTAWNAHAAVWLLCAIHTQDTQRKKITLPLVFAMLTSGCVSATAYISARQVAGSMSTYTAWSLLFGLWANTAPILLSIVHNFRADSHAVIYELVSDVSATALFASLLLAVAMTARQAAGGSV